MGVLAYNGVTLPYSNCTSFQQEALADDIGHTDWYVTKFDVQVQCLLNVNYLSLIAPGLVSTGNAPMTRNPAEIMSWLRTQLMRRRRPLSYKINGVELIPKPQLTSQAINSPTILGYVDAQNGPIPQSCNLTYLTDETFLLNYHVIAHYWENTALDQTSGSPNLVKNKAGNTTLYNRWTETVDIDEVQLTTRTRSGKLVIRSDNIGGLTADAVRTEMAVVGVPKPYFTRKSSHYTIDPNGLGVAYRVVDQEHFKMPPKPAYKAEGEWIEDGPGIGGIRNGTIRVKLFGSSHIKQLDLLDTALGIARTKLTLASHTTVAVSFLAPSITIDVPNFFPTNCRVVVPLYENWVEVTASALYPIGTNRYRDFAAFGGTRMTFTPGSDGIDAKTAVPDYFVRGTANLFLEAARYYYPRLATAQMNGDGTNLNAGVEPGEDGKTRSA